MILNISLFFDLKLYAFDQLGLYTGHYLNNLTQINQKKLQQYHNQIKALSIQKLNCNPLIIAY